ncbi:hypothetical protein GCM10029992_51310 [Glycomyces albus]
MTSNVGENGARDPFLVRSPEDGKYYMIATDLRIYGDGDWDRAQRHGSRSLVVWESTDLVDWSPARLASVSPESAGNTWAPEAYWDPTQNAFVVYWASKLYSTSDHSDETYQRMMYATTTDFRNFSQARVWVDKGYHTIDSTIAEHDGTYYRYTADARSGTNCGRYILSETSASLTNTNWSFQAECIGSGTIDRGEGPLVFKSNTEDRWYMFIDEHGGRGYVRSRPPTCRAANGRRSRATACRAGLDTDRSCLSHPRSTRRCRTAGDSPSVPGGRQLIADRAGQGRVGACEARWPIKGSSRAAPMSGRSGRERGLFHRREDRCPHQSGISWFDRFLILFPGAAWSGAVSWAETEDEMGYEHEQARTARNVAWGRSGRGGDGRLRLGERDGRGERDRRSDDRVRRHLRNLRRGVLAATELLRPRLR